VDQTVPVEIRQARRRARRVSVSRDIYMYMYMYMRERGSEVYTRSSAEERGAIKEEEYF
jgi:hypothetical protein